MPRSPVSTSLRQSGARAARRRNRSARGARLPHIDLERGAARHSRIPATFHHGNRRVCRAPHRQLSAQSRTAPRCARRNYGAEILDAVERPIWSAGLSLCGNHAALNWISSSSPAIARNTTFGKGVAIVASLVKADAETYGHQMHQGVAANIEFLHIGVIIAAGQPSGEPVAKCAVALGLAYTCDRRHRTTTPQAGCVSCSLRRSSRASAVAQMQPSARASWRPSCSAWRYAGTF
jgi:hypothetical protein